MNISNQDLSRLVKEALNDQELSLESCCKHFNNRYLKEINQGEIKPLNKDFLSRVTRNDFKVWSGRISKLCEFLKIQEKKGTSIDPLNLLSNQIKDFEEQMNSDKEFRKKYSAVFNFLAGLNLNQIQRGN